MHEIIDVHARRQSHGDHGLERDEDGSGVMSVYIAAYHGKGTVVDRGATVSVGRVAESWPRRERAPSALVNRGIIRPAYYIIPVVRTQDNVTIFSACMYYNARGHY